MVPRRGCLTSTVMGARARHRRPKDHGDAGCADRGKGMAGRRTSRCVFYFLGKHPCANLPAKETPASGWLVGGRGSTCESNLVASPG